MTETRPPYTGHCLCGAVRFEVRGPLANTHACHCGQCRRQSGHFVVGASAERADLKFLSDATLAWYQSSPSARRGFCSTCGSVMLWDDGGTTVGINLGSLDQPTGLRIEKHIFVEDKADYYEIDTDGAARFRGYDTPA
ncbi:MAG: GFA family protein [Hyphomicrobiaceae bacterium]